MIETVQIEEDTSSNLASQPVPVRVAIQGYAGAFHEIAAKCHFNHAVAVPAHTFEDVVKLVEEGKEVDAGLMAIENTLAGTLMKNYRLLDKANLEIVGEVYLRIKQNLMVLPGQEISQITEVHSHPIAIDQCREFFAQYPHIQLVETVDTALSAREIREKQLTNRGAIASTLAAEIYDLEIIGKSIETNKKNYTRFLVLHKKGSTPSPKDANKVSLCFATPHEVGSLFKVLGVMAAYNVNLTKIQSMPIVGRQWEYQFFVDFLVEGHVPYDQAIQAIRPLTKDLQVLGIYRSGKHHDV